MKYSVRRVSASESWKFGVLVSFFLLGLFVLILCCGLQRWNIDATMERYTREVYPEGENGTDNFEINGTTPFNTTDVPLLVDDDFPWSVFTLDQLQNGAVIVPLLVAAYMVLALTIVCEDYFVPSMESLCNTLGLSQDVAGATFMAIGSSAPEFFTSIIGIVMSESDVSLGTILGSVAFNVLFIIGLLGIIFGKSDKLSWWPLLRDLICYVISVVALACVIKDGHVFWFEALILVVLYGLYIVLMYFNEALRKLTENIVRTYTNRDREEEMQILREDLKSTGRNDALDRMKDADILENGNVVKEENIKESTEECCSIFNSPDGCLKKAIWLTCLPIKLAFCITIPDCRKPRWQRCYLLTALMSAVWLGGLSYILVWMVSVMGFTIGMPEAVMALIFLGAGSSVPDLVASLLVARDGYWDMAVANCLGSNIFEVLICLALPWFVETIFYSAHCVTFPSSGMTFISCLMILAVVLTEVTIMCNNWTITRSTGILFLILYIAFIVSTILYGTFTGNTSLV